MPEEPEYSFFACSNIGVAGTTPVTIKKTPQGFEARVGIALLGYSNLDEEGFEKAQYNPFHELFHDNYASGIGATIEEAIEKMKESLRDISNSLF